MRRAEGVSRSAGSLAGQPASLGAEHWFGPCLLVCLVALGGCADRPVPESTVVVAYPAGPTDLRPHVANDEHTFSILSNVYETLVDFDADLSLSPGIASTWHTPDDHTWEFEIRPGVRFQNGKLLTIEDVVRSLEDVRTDPDSRRRAELLEIESVAALGPDRLEIKTRHPVATLPNRLGNAPIWIEDPGVDWPIGTGPYRIEEWTPRGTTVLSAFDDHRSHVAVRRLEFRVVPDEDQRIRLLQAGEAQLVAQVSPEFLEGLAAEDGLRVLQRKALTVFFLAMDCARSQNPQSEAGPNPFRDPRVRHAVARAVDREGLVAGAMGGRAEVVDQVVGPEVFGFHPDLTPWEHDPEEARRLLRQAGFEGGFSVVLDYDPDGIRSSVIDALAADLAAVGINLEPRAQDLQTLIARIEERRTAFYLLYWISTSGDFGLSAQYLLHSPGGPHGIDNGGGYSNPRVDALLDEASQEMDPIKRKRLLHAVAAIVHGEAPVVPLFRTVDNYVVAAELDFAPRLDRQVRGSGLRWGRPGS